MHLINMEGEAQKIQATCPKYLKAWLADSTMPLFTIAKCHSSNYCTPNNLPKNIQCSNSFNILKLKTT